MGLMGGFGEDLFYCDFTFAAAVDA